MNDESMRTSLIRDWVRLLGGAVAVLALEKRPRALVMDIFVLFLARRFLQTHWLWLLSLSLLMQLMLLLYLILMLLNLLLLHNI